jgi:hypothetical protein
VKIPSARALARGLARPPSRAKASARTIAFAAFAALCIAFGPLLASCGGKPPEVNVVDWRLELRPSKGGAYESLSVFSSLKDDDGIEDIEELWIIQDDEALSWKLTNADWTKKTEGADNWIGAAGLARNDYGQMPRGEYRVVAIDAAGERVEKAFKVDGAFPDLPMPEIALEAGLIRAKSSWPETLVLAYDGTGALAGSASASAEAESLADLFGAEVAARVVEVAAYGYDPARKMGAYSWKKKAR